MNTEYKPHIITRIPIWLVFVMGIAASALTWISAAYLIKSLAGDFVKQQHFDPLAAEEAFHKSLGYVVQRTNIDGQTRLIVTVPSSKK